MEIDSVTRPSYAAVTTAPSSDSTTVPTQVNRVVSSVSSRASVASAVVTPPATASHFFDQSSCESVTATGAGLSGNTELLARGLKKRL